MVIAEILPMLLLLAPVAGAVVDRLPRVRVMIAADLARIVLAAALPLLDQHLVAIYMVAVGMSIGSVLFNPATTSALPSIVDEDELVAANSGEAPNHVGSTTELPAAISEMEGELVHRRPGTAPGTAIDPVRGMTVPLTDAAVPSLAAYQLAFEIFYGQQRVAAERERLATIVTTELRNAHPGPITDTEWHRLRAVARDVQDGVLRTRLDVSRVPERFSKWHRTNDERDFADTAEGHRRRLAAGTGQ